MFDNSTTEEFFFLIKNLQNTLEASGALSASANIQYLCTMFCGEMFRQLDMMSVGVGSTNTTDLTRTILGLSTYFSINVLSKQTCVMRHGMRKPHELKLRRYAARMIELN